MVFIKNLDLLATSDLRADALSILESGYAAIATPLSVRRAVSREENILRVDDVVYDLSVIKRIRVVGIGKCALDACKELEVILGERLESGIVIDTRRDPAWHSTKFTQFVGTHPFPSPENVVAAEAVVDLLSDGRPDDLVIAVVSGGGSALLCLPPDGTCEPIREVTKHLMNAGATIYEMNTVRKHASLLQGGQLAKLMYPARVATLIFSDVPGNAIDVIASGPTVKDETTVADARAVLSRYGALEGHDETLTLVETPKEDEYFSRVHNILIVSNRIALQAMQRTAQELGYDATIEDDKITGDVHDVAQVLVSRASDPKTCRLYGGETTVVVKSKNGVGGRNQHLALAALQGIPEHTVLVAAASDGWDNGEAAGAIVDAELRKVARQRHFDPKEFLRAMESFAFFANNGGQIVTGQTGSNVADFYFTLHA